MNTEEVHELETSLKNFFLNSNDIKDASSHSNKMKYRGLSITIDKADKTEPTFKVRIGAFEATFRISDGLKIHGSLCGDEKMIIKWYHRGSNKQAIQNLSDKSEQIRVQTGNTNYANTDLGINKK